MKTQNVGNILIVLPSKTISVCFLSLAPNNVNSCWAMTERTSMLIRLNSSKQIQAPQQASPLKNLPIIT